MERLVLLACLSAVCVAQTNIVDPRGARPVVPNTRSEKCATQKEWPFCTTDEWGPKCPSGCRIHGLLEKYDHSFLKRIEKIRSLLDDNKAKHRSANQVSKQTYDFLKEKLTIDAGNDNSYFDLAQNLRKRITEMKIKIDRQLGVLAALKEKVRDQVADMKKLEVDIDIKLRSCKGSCKGNTPYELDHESYVALDKQMAQLDSLSGQSIESVGTLYVMKSRDIKDAVLDTTYKSGDSPAAAQLTETEDMFSDVNNVQLVLEQEGSINSPATISKDTVCLRLKDQSPGARQPQTYRGQQCRRRNSDTVLCADDDWISKCPSGCRLQGLISQAEGDIERKLTKICKIAEKCEISNEKSLKATAYVDYYSGKIISEQTLSEQKFIEKAEGLTTNLTSLRKQSAQMSASLTDLRNIVQKQIEELLRTEVDIDMKLRACRGSCRSVEPFSMDRSSYDTLWSDMVQLDHIQKKKTPPPSEGVPHLRRLPVDADSSGQRKILFDDNGIHQLVLEDSETELE